MPNPTISQITLPSNNTYDIKDAQARTDIQTIQQQLQGGMHWLGVTTTAISDGSTTATISIGGESVTLTADDAGSVVGYGNKEFIWSGTTWQEFGDMSSLGTMAYVNSASGSYTPAGSVSQPTFSNGAISGSGTTTPSGTISVGTGTANYTPAGSVAAPTISVSTAGSTTTIKNPTKATVVTGVTMPTYTVANEVLTITAGSSSTGDSISTTDVTVKTGDAAYSATAPAFTGTGAELKFTGTQATVNVTGTATGTVSKPSFTGTAATITVTP